MREAYARTAGGEGSMYQPFNEKWHLAAHKNELLDKTKIH
jgi:hypothetical protein